MKIERGFKIGLLNAGIVSLALILAACGGSSSQASSSTNENCGKSLELNSVYGPFCGEREIFENNEGEFRINHLFALKWKDPGLFTLIGGGVDKTLTGKVEGSAISDKQFVLKYGNENYVYTATVQTAENGLVSLYVVGNASLFR
jgi:hypothetical protein